MSTEAEHQKYLDEQPFSPAKRKQLQEDINNQRLGASRDEMNLSAIANMGGYNGLSSDIVSYDLNSENVQIGDGHAGNYNQFLIKAKTITIKPISFQDKIFYYAMKGTQVSNDISAFGLLQIAVGIGVCFLPPPFDIPGPFLIDAGVATLTSANYINRDSAAFAIASKAYDVVESDGTTKELSEVTESILISEGLNIVGGKIKTSTRFLAANSTNVAIGYLSGYNIGNKYGNTFASVSTRVNIQYYKKR